jgi:hypothetical protein
LHRIQGRVEPRRGRTVVGAFVSLDGQSERMLGGLLLCFDPQLSPDSRLPWLLSPRGMSQIGPGDSRSRQGGSPSSNLSPVTSSQLPPPRNPESRLITLPDINHILSHLRDPTYTEFSAARCVTSLCRIFVLVLMMHRRRFLLHWSHVAPLLQICRARSLTCCEGV